MSDNAKKPTENQDLDALWAAFQAAKLRSIETLDAMDFFEAQAAYEAFLLALTGERS